MNGANQALVEKAAMSSSSRKKLERGVHESGCQTTPRLRADMQRELFFSSVKRPSQDDLRSLARSIGVDHIFLPFQIRVVGSMLTQPSFANDIDVLLTRRDRRRLCILDLQTALMTARRIGIHHLGISVDPFFRNSLGDVLAGPIRAETELQTWKLEDYLHVPYARMGLMRNYRRVGDYMVVVRQQASEVRFFKKLPVDRANEPNRQRTLTRGKLLESFA